MWPVVFLVSLIFLLRTGLIVIGLFKGPVLRSFEKYGDEETFYYPVAHLIIWSVPFFLSTILGFVQPMLTQRPILPHVSIVLGFLVLTFTFWLYPRVIIIARRYPDIFLRYPRWYARLSQRTSRVERRRIAYRWLHLPRRTRLIYSSNDRAFFIWADLVILATISGDLETP